MREPVRRLSTYLAAVLLAGLTLGVFATQVNGGPESAIRKFHEAVSSRDARMLQSTLLQDLGAPSATFLAGRAQQVGMMGGSYDVIRTITQGTVAQVEVAYSVPGTRPQSTYWMVRATRYGWKVDADGTLNMMRSSLGL